MKLHKILQALQNWAPFSFQESYDNSGLIVGDDGAEIYKALITLDITEVVLQEAIEGGFNLIISHHPILFRGIKSLTGKNEEERVLILAIKHNIAIVAMHTNLDNVFHGVNAKISQILGLQNLNILQPKEGILKKLSVFIPTKNLEIVRKTIFNAGAGQIGDYEECSFGVDGIGTFKGNKLSDPYAGEAGKFHEEAEVKMETIFPSHLQNKIIKALVETHPYEEPAFDIYPLDNQYQRVGAGMIGDLTQEMDEIEFLKFLKQKMKTSCVRHTALRGKMVKRVALCGGSGSFLIHAAKASQADVFITGDVKYHEFFDAGNNMMIADVGHFESEQFTKDLIGEFLIEFFPNFAVQISEHNTNPINYF